VFGTVEQGVFAAVQWLRLGLEAVGAIIVAIGGVRGIVGLASGLTGPGERSFGAVRLTLARHLSLALEFQLAADILSTAIAPSWDQIGKLGAIAVIRTSLNYFLAREMASEAGADADRVAGEGPGTRTPSPG
jgi:uncharacterized membrane protein